MSVHRFLLRHTAVVVLGVLLPLAAYAQAPATLSYQGRLLDAEGAPLPDATYSLTLRLYDQATDGIALWTETQDATVTDGLFSLTLGTETSLADLAFDTAYWLGVTVAGENTTAMNSAPARRSRRPPTAIAPAPSTTPRW